MVLQRGRAELHTAHRASVPVRRHTRTAFWALEGPLLGGCEPDAAGAILGGLGHKSAAGRTLIQKEGDILVVAGKLPGGIG